MKLKNLLLSIVIFLGFVGCAPKVVTPEIIGSISKLGVISVHGTKMKVIERGITIFGNEDEVNDISSWKLDEYMQKEMLKSLTSNSMQLVPLSFSSQQINAFYENEESSNTIFKDLMVKNNIDGLIVLHRGPIIPEHGLSTRGVSIIKTKMLGVHGTDILMNFALLTYQLVDNELKVIQFSRFVESEKIDNNLWIDTKNPITEDNLQHIESKVKKTLVDSISGAIKEAGF